MYNSNASDIHPTNKSKVKDGEYYGLVPVGSIVSTVTVFCSNILIKTFTDNLPRSLDCFQLRFIIMEKGLQIFGNSKSVHDEKGDS